ncbi:MAG: BlaI/MecI/CopY family transcriptional regulator [Oscillospiraceae bacterium]
MEFTLSEAELYIMRFFWAHGPMKSSRLAQLTSQKGWKATTLLTFLSRLVAKGMLSNQKEGKANLYSPLISEAEYKAGEGKTFLNEMYGGSAKNFLAALVNNNGMSATDLEELKQWLTEQEDTPDA